MLNILNKIRIFFRGAIAKIILITIGLSFLIAGGLGTSINTKPSVAIVNGDEILAEDFVKEYRSRLKLSGLRAASTDELNQLKIAENVLEYIIFEKLVEVETKNIDLKASDSFIADIIKNTNYFFVNGSFSKDKFKNVLQVNNITEKRYIDIITNDLTNQRYKNALKGIPFSLKNITEQMAKSTLQLRTGIKASRDLSSIKTKDYNDGDLKKFYTANTEKLRTLERRDASVLVFDTQKIASFISNKQASDYYSANISSYKIPETRDFLRFDGSKEDLEKVKKALAGGKSLGASVKEILNQPLGKYFTKSAVSSSIDPNASSIVFSLKLKKLSAPIEGAFGYSMFYVTKIVPQTNLSFEAISGSIKVLLAEEKIIDYINDAEDALSSGQTLKEIGQKLSLEIISVKDLTLNGMRGELTSSNEFVKEIFETELNDYTRTTELANGQFFIAVVDKVEKSYIPKFAKVKKQVAKLYVQNQRVKILTKWLGELIKEKSAQKFSSLALKNGFKITPLNNLNKRKAYTNQANSLLFEINPNSATTAIIDNAGYAVFMSSATFPKKINIDNLKGERDNMQDALNSEIDNAIISYLQQKYDVTINNEALRKINITINN